MNYNEFTDKVVAALGTIMEGNPVISKSMVNKNNGILKTGITIMYPGEGVTPNIYLDDYYDEDIEDGDILDIAMSIKKLYYKCRPTKKVDVSFYMNYEEARDHLFLKIINRELNENLLQKAPHYSFLDMEVVAYCKIDDEVLGNGSIIVLNSHMETWGIDSERLFEDCYTNMLNHQEPELMNITDIMEGMIYDSCLSVEEKESIKEEMAATREMYDALPMHVLSNRERTFGASLILNENYLLNLSNSFKSDFYILPSSIHELILIPVDNSSKVWELKDMVRSVNDTAVEKEELLSYSVYLFSQREGKVLVAM